MKTMYANAQPAAKWDKRVQVRKTIDAPKAWEEKMKSFLGKFGDSEKLHTCPRQDTCPEKMALKLSPLADL